MMKLIALGAAACALILSACATAPAGEQQLPTPAQVAAQVCPSAQAVLTVLTTPSAIDETAAAKLAAAAPVVNAVCAAGASVTAVDLRTLAKDGLPAILMIVQASPLPDKDKQVAVLAIAVAQAALAPILAANASAPPVTPVPAASAPAAK